MIKRKMLRAKARSVIKAFRIIHGLTITNDLVQKLRFPPARLRENLALATPVTRNGAPTPQ